MIAFLIKYDWLGHIVEAIVMGAIVTLLFLPWEQWRVAVQLGSVWAAAHYHGREKRDCEVSLGMRPPHLEAYKFWIWNKDQLTDFFPVFGLAAIVYILTKVL